MPSFLEALKRIVQGKPVFDAYDEGGKPPANGAGGVPLAQQIHGGAKVLPLVFIEQSSCRVHGTNMKCQVVIKNSSHLTIELDKIKLLKTSKELDSFLKPGQEREYQIYSGPRPQNTYEDIAYVYYKDPSGDYFCAEHYIDLQRQSDNTYIIRHFRLQQPIRDV